MDWMAEYNRDAVYHVSDSMLLRKGGSVGDGPCPAKTIRNTPKRSQSMKKWSGVVDRYVDDYNGLQDEWIGWQNIQINEKRRREKKINEKYNWKN